MAEKLYKDKTWLEEQYVTKGLVITQVAALAGCSQSTIFAALKSFNIPIRSIRIRGSAKDKLSSPAWLKSQYVVAGRSALDIARELGVDVGTVLPKLRKFNITVRDARTTAIMAVLPTEKTQKLLDRDWLYSEYVLKERSIPQIGREHGLSRSSITNALKSFEISIRETSETNHLVRVSKETRRKLDDPHWLKTEYIDNKRDSYDIARECGVCNHTITSALRKNHVPVRTFGESHTGELHPGWRNGSSYAPYCVKFNEQFKCLVRSNFGHKCYICGKGRGAKDLAVHHVDYNKNSICKGRNWAFVPLCASCHSKSNMNRWYWFNLLIYYWANNPEINFNNSIMVTNI